MLTCIASFLSGQDNYDKDWNSVLSFENDGLTKSASELVDKIFTRAKAENNSKQIVKSLLHQSKYLQVLEEDAQLKIVTNFKTEIENSNAVTKHLLVNILANIYWQYYKQNRWKFYNRTSSISATKNNDFRTWDLDTLFNEIHKYFQCSLEDAELLQNEDLKNYSKLLIEVENSKDYRPTLYDLLSHNALDFYKTPENSLTQPSYQFTIDDDAYIAEHETFTKLNITSKDSVNLQLNALKIYQNLIRFHQKNKNSKALVSVNIQRLNFVKNNATFDTKDIKLLATLQKELKGLKNKASSTLYNFELANTLFEQGLKYDAKQSNTSNLRWKKKEALQICESVINSYPDSDGAKKCNILKTRIQQPSLSLRTEKYIPINSPALILVNYKNLDELTFKIHKVNHDQLKKFNKLYNANEKEGFLSKLKVYKTFSSHLKDENDYQDHSIEAVLPQLDNGLFLIVAKTNTKVFAVTDIQVTNMALIETEDNNGIIYQLINRNNGNPIPNANVQLHYRSNRNVEKKLGSNFITNDKGQFYFKKRNSNYYSVYAVIKKDNETAIFGDTYIRKAYKTDEKKDTTYKTFIITDRSIYRPGQTVYFKGISTQTKDKNTTVLEDENITATLYDINGQELSKQEFSTNAYGSFHGEFILPTGGFTGNFFIKATSDKTGTHSKNFSVEEYKRPKFETSFEPITESYQVNDSIKVTGKALAFAGSTISEAKVVYRVKRNVQYPSWYYWRRPNYNSNIQEITFGESVTDADGQFEIVFKAIPDASTSKKNLPVFTYEVTADVTDINGETRSASTIVRVGYHTLLATLDIPKRIDKSKKETEILINTTNLNGEFTPAKGVVKIYKLVGPEYVLRSRPWEAPDYKSLSENDFKMQFPHWAYDNESDFRNWQKGALVFEMAFDTKVSKAIILKRIKKWNSGKYRIELDTKDKFRQDVTDKSYFDVYSENDKGVADNDFFNISLDKDNYEINSNAQLGFSSAANNATATISIEKNGKIIDTQIHQLNNNKKNIQLPVNSEDIGGFVVHYSFVALNSIKSGSILVNVPYPKTDLQIETKTFRDKLQPGQDETWSFKIKGAKGEKVAAEILASMYDASLDEFTSGDWYFNPIHRPQYRKRSNFNSSKSFSTIAFRRYHNFKNIPYYPSQNFDRLNWFGFQFGNEQYLRRQYLRRFKVIDAVVKSSYKTTIKKNTIEGVVLDEDGLALPGVNILIKNTSTGTTSDFDGKFSINAKTGNTLEFSYLGFRTSKYTIKKDNYARVTLIEDTNTLDEVVVVGAVQDDNIQVERAMSGKIPGLNTIANSTAEGTAANVNIRGSFSPSAASGLRNPIYIIDGIETEIKSISNIDPKSIISMKVLKDDEAINLYGKKGENGVVLIITKKGIQKNQNFQIRKNLNETAFFFPQLTTDAEGHVSFNFKAPEALTQWKLQLLAHTKTLESSIAQFEAVTQKELMVIPNAPRFLRQGDDIVISTKIANLSDKNLTGIARLELTDAITGKNITDMMVAEALEVTKKSSKVASRASATKEFLLNSKGNTEVSWQLNIPDNIQAIQYTVTAQSQDFSDGEQSVLPVLTNRMLVTETLPMWIKSNETRTFTLDKLASTKSTTLKHHKLTLEMTSNPAWYAVQALPYLMEYPYECNEQTFSRYYANALAQYITKSNPKIEAVFNQWNTSTSSVSSDALLSNLEKNQELKSLLIEETPWLRDAQSETEQKKRIALLFDLNKMNNELKKSLRKLKNNQHNSGAWPWFNGGYDNRYITQHIIGGFGHLKKLGVSLDNFNGQNKMIEKAIQYLDSQFVEEYEDLKRYNNNVDLSKDHLSHTQLHYLYVRSFFSEIQTSKKVARISEYYKGQIKKYWLKRSLFAKGLMVLIMHRNNDKTTTAKILNALQENSITSEELGMYWKENTASWYWHQAPIETQALLIEAFSEAGLSQYVTLSAVEAEKKNLETIDNLKIWLLKNKQTNKWETTKATTEAVYALLLQGSDWLSVTDAIDVTVGNQKIDTNVLENVSVEAGTGYYKTSWNGKEIHPELANVTLSKKGNGIAWGALYWQYFEDLDKITSAKTPLKLNKKLFLKQNTDRGEQISEITKNTQLKVGDLVRVRIELRSDRDMEFLHLKDMRATGFEPINVLSQYKWQDGLGYYESTRDAATNFFIDYLPKGIYVFEYDLRVNNAGDMSNGITTIQSMYAPEFSSHSEGIRVNVE